MRIGHSFVYSILLILLFCFPYCISAQQKILSSSYRDSALLHPEGLTINCASDNLLNELRKDPAYVAKEKKMNEDILNAMNITRKLLGGSGTTADPYILPVVFHIINSNPASITDADIIAAVKDLNDAFSKSGNYSASAGADTKIRFKLAKKDPDGGITNGITRTQSFYSDNMHMILEDVRLKNLVIWNPLKYINIWLVKNIIGEISANFSCGVWTRLGPGGYATLPPNGTVTDGIVIAGTGGVVLAHEMGHYLGLYHTFEGGCTNNNCTTDGDRVCATAFSKCPS